MTLYPTLNQVNPVHAIPSCSCLTQFILIIPTTPKSSKQPVFFFRFCNQSLCKFPFSPTNAVALPTITLITFHEKFEHEVPHYANFSMLLLITYSTRKISSWASSSRQTPGLRFSLHVRKQVSQPYKRGRVNIRHILTVVFLLANGMTIDNPNSYEK